MTFRHNFTQENQENNYSMAENQEREKISLDFGIEDTVNTGDSKVVIDSLFGGETVKSNPDEVKMNTGKQKSSSTTETSTKKPGAQDKQTQINQEDNSEGDDKEKENEFVLTPDDVFGREDTKDDEDNDDSQENSDEGKKDEPTEGGEGAENPLTSLSKDLVKLGIFRKQEGETDESFNFQDPNDFLKRFNFESNQRASDTIDSFLSRFGEDYHEMFDAVFVKGVDPQDYLKTFIKLQDVSSLDMTKEGDQQQVYREYWRRQGFSEDRIEAKLQRAKVNGELEEDSTEFQKALVDQDARELERKKEEAEQVNLRKFESKKAFAQNANKILTEKIAAKEFDGIPVSQQLAQQAFTFVTQEKYKLANGEPITEFDKFVLDLQKPENHALKLKIALLALGGFDLSKIKVKEANDKTKQTFAWATKGKSASSTKTQTSSSPKVVEDKF